MAISKKHLTGELIPGKLDVSEQSKIGFANVFARSGLQNDIAAEANDFKLEVEVELSDIKNISIEIEAELKIATIAKDSIETDKEALNREAVNRDVLDYSIKSFNNQMNSNNRNDLVIETIESAGMQGIIGSMVGGSISSGLKYIMDNKKEILTKAWEKLKQLYKVLIKKIKEYYRKGFYALHKMINMPTKILEKMSGLPAGQLVTEDMLSEETKLDLYKGFAIFAILNHKGKNPYMFDFSEDIDKLRMEQVFSGKMFLDIEAAAKEGKLPNRDVELLNLLSSPEVLKEYFNFVVPAGYDISKSVIVPISFNTDGVDSKSTAVDYLLANSEFYTEDSLDLSVSSATSMRAVLKPGIADKITVKLSTVGDINRIASILVNFNANVLKNIEDEQNKGLIALEKKVDSLDVDDKDMQAKFKIYKNIYDMLSIMALTNLMGMTNTYVRAVRPLEAIADEVVAYNAKRFEAGNQSEVKAGLQFDIYDYLPELPKEEKEKREKIKKLKEEIADKNEQWKKEGKGLFERLGLKQKAWKEGYDKIMSGYNAKVNKMDSSKIKPMSEDKVREYSKLNNEAFKAIKEAYKKYSNIKEWRALEQEAPNDEWGTWDNFITGKLDTYSIASVSWDQEDWSDFGNELVDAANTILSKKGYGENILSIGGDGDEGIIDINTSSAKINFDKLK